jgi:hypothetical protein
MTFSRFMFYIIIATIVALFFALGLQSVLQHFNLVS